MAVAGRESVVILSTRNEIWRYKIYDDSWQRVTSFIPNNDNLQTEYPVKLSHARCTVVLTNLGMQHETTHSLHLHAYQMHLKKIRI